MLAGEGVYGPADRQGYGKCQRHVADDGNELAAHGIDHQLRELLQMFFLAVALLDGLGDGRRGHGRLLGCHREVQHVNQHEADAVVEAEQYGLGKLRQMQLGDVDLEHGHEGDDESGARGGLEERQVFFLVAGDVMLAGLARVVGDAQRQQVYVAQHVAGDIILFVLRAGEFRK